MSYNPDDFVFFWDGPFSQWHPCKFTSPYGISKNIMYNCSEQFMMFQKAIFFNDLETAVLILDSNSPREQKALGRKVANFNLKLWNAHAKDIVYEGNKAKFTQNRELLDILLSTGDKVLVEASPYDDIWGIGLDEATARVTPPNKWRGSNWLGQVLTKLRDDLK